MMDALVSSWTGVPKASRVIPSKPRPKPAGPYVKTALLEAEEDFGIEFGSEFRFGNGLEGKLHGPGSSLHDPEPRERVGGLDDGIVEIEARGSNILQRQDGGVGLARKAEWIKAGDAR